MKKRNFKNILSLALAALMVMGTVGLLASTSVGAEALIFETLEGNTEYDIGGIKIRLDHPSAHSDASLKLNSDGSVTMKGSRGDLFWISNVLLTSESVLTTVVTFDASAAPNSCCAGTTYDIDANGAWDEDTDTAIVAALRTFSGGSSRRSIATTNYSKATVNADFVNVLTDVNYTATNNYFGNSWQPEKTVKTVISQSADGTVSAVFLDDNGDEVTSASYNNSEYPLEGFAGFMTHWTNGKDYNEYTIHEFKITNAKVNGELVEEFDLGAYVKAYMDEKLEVPFMMLNSALEFDGGFVFADYEFIVNEDYVATSQIVVCKNSTEIARRNVSELTEEEGKYTYTAYFEYGEGYAKSDVLTFKLVNNGETVAGSESTIKLGEKYDSFINKPYTLPSSADLQYMIYAEDFSEDVVLVPGENIINGHKWTYIKNSTDGSAVIKSGRLYFTGSNNDMLLIDDVVLDKSSYKFTYDVTYLETPEDDIWDKFDCWFGGVFHLANEADPSGNRNAIIVAVTPDDVHMMQGKVNASGVFTEDESLSSHKAFLTSGVYWSGRVGNATPATIHNYVGLDAGDNGGIYLSGYNNVGDHRIADNLPGSGALANEVRVGRVGFACSESRVSVIVDNLEILTKGKSVVVDDEEIQVAGNGIVDIELLEKDEMKLIYANVDGTPKYAGDVITANRLTKISTTQITFNTNKVAAVGQTGLKWTTLISKADYEKLTGDSNIARVEVGTVAAPTENALNGVDLSNATSNIAGEAIFDGENYVFEGVLSIDKSERDTSYSGVGYVKVTMEDGKEIIVYGDYIKRMHAYALSDLVEEFVDDEPAGDNNGDNGNDNNNADTDLNTDTESGTSENEPSVEEKSFFEMIIDAIISFFENLIAMIFGEKE